MPTFKRQDQEQLEKAQDLLEGQPAAELGFVKSLFFGRLRLDQVIPYPIADADESRRTDELLVKLDAFMAEHIDPEAIDLEERIPQDVIEGLARLGILGMTVPVEYGGGGFSHTAYCRIIERISTHCASTAVLVGAHQSIGLKALLLMGNEQQKRQYLPALARGEMLAAFCLSEPEVGSDAANVQTTGRLSDDGEYWIINGQKRYATNGALAGFMTVMVRTPVTIDGKTKDKVTAFIVTPDLPGFEVVSPNRSKCGVCGSWQATLHFNDMRVPKDRILGELGKGLRVALSVLDFGRCTLSAGCAGGAKRSLELAIKHATGRRQFGRPISEFGLIKAKIANMAEMAFAIDAIAYLCAGLVDRHAGDIMLETAIAKLFCSEGLWKIADDLVQIYGGEGYMRDRGIERMFRDSRINRIVEGTTEVMTAFIALVGMKGVGEELEGVLRAAKHPVGNLGRLAHFAKGQWDDILIGAECAGLHDELEAEGDALARLTRLLARDVLRLLKTYRERILDQQLLLERVTWAVVDLYAMAAVISKMQGMLTSGSADKSNPAPVKDGLGDPAMHANGNGSGNRTGTPQARGGIDNPNRKQLLIGKAFCHHAVQRIEQRLHGLFTNHDEEITTVADVVLGLKEVDASPQPAGGEQPAQQGK